MHKQCSCIKYVHRISKTGHLICKTGTNRLYITKILDTGGKISGIHGQRNACIARDKCSQ